MHSLVSYAAHRDAEWITALWNDIIAHTLVTFTTRLKRIDEVRGMIQDHSVLVLNDAKGFAVFGPFRAGPGYAGTVEHTIYINPKARGQGLGAILLAELITHAELEAHHVMVAGISGANPGAVRFHARLGFETVGHMPQVGFKNDQWLDLILMQKMLNPPDTGDTQG